MFPLEPLAVVMGVETRDGPGSVVSESTEQKQEVSLETPVNQII